MREYGYDLTLQKFKQYIGFDNTEDAKVTLKIMNKFIFFNLLEGVQRSTQEIETTQKRATNVFRITQNKRIRRKKYDSR